MIGVAFLLKIVLIVELVLKSILFSSSLPFLKGIPSSLSETVIKYSYTHIETQKYFLNRLVILYIFDKRITILYNTMIIDQYFMKSTTTNFLEA